MLLRFVLHRLLRVIVVLLGVALIMFLLMHAIPGNPWSNYSSAVRMQMNTSSDQSFQRQLSHHFGLDLPLWRQFTRYVLGDLDQDGRFICGVLCGNLGPSISQRGRSVADVLFEPPEGMPAWNSRFGYSIRLVLFGSLIAVGLGVPLGIMSGARPNSAASRGISIGLAALLSIPNFVLGLLAIIVLSSWLELIPVLPDWDQPSNWIVPAVVLAVMPMASIARVTRASLINILGEDHVRTAHGKGLPPGYVLRVHVLRNALAPILTFLGPILMEMFIALLVVENLYAFPGFGREYWEAVLALDYPVIMGLTLLYAVGILFVNLVIEIICEALDPRLRSIRQLGAP
jgi:oligopeptide transport system permease protein